MARWAWDIRAGRPMDAPRTRTRTLMLTAPGAIAVVHNGILENYAELKQRLSASGHRFRSETDTEVIAHLVEAHWTGVAE